MGLAERPGSGSSCVIGLWPGRLRSVAGDSKAVVVLETESRRRNYAERVWSVARFQEPAFALDAPGLAATLRSLDEEERERARSWVLKEKQFFEVVRDREPRPLGTDEPGWELLGSGAWMRVMCLVALCSPAEAARAIRWGDIWDHMCPPARECAAQLVATRPREWAETFLTTTAGVRLSKETARNGGSQLAWLVSRGLADHDLPCPAGQTFLEHHLRDDWRATVDAEAIRAERLVPEIVYRMVGAGVASNLGTLPETVVELVADGTLDRGRIMEVCLESLTAQTRPSSQRVVAKVLEALDVPPEDVPGGMSYLCGVIATSDPLVGRALLPRALALADDAAALEELSRVVAGRKERRPKQVLLAALREPQTASRVGRDGVLRALEVLAAGQEDASLVRDIEAARADLGAPVDPGEDRVGSTGLWQAEIEPGPGLDRPWWLQDRHTNLPAFLVRGSPEYASCFELMVDDFVRDLAATGDASGLVALCHRMRVDGDLALTRLTRLLEPGFLAGGLRLLWPAALEIADDVASAHRVLAGLPELLRLLTRYATEVPDGWTLPPHLARRATAAGATKTQLEARALGAALARVHPDTFEAEPPARAAAPSRGLWEKRQVVPVLARLLDPHYPHHHPSEHQLHFELALGDGVGHRFRRGEGLFTQELPFEAIHMDHRLVSHLAVEVQLNGVDDVRRRLAGTQRMRGSDRGPTCRAIRRWQDGDLTPDTFDEVLAADRADGPAIDRVVFAWTCEQLVRLPEHPALLCHPGGRPEATVGPVVLVEQVRALAGIATVGPMDALLALTRLDLEGPGSHAALEALAGMELWTDPLVTRTRSGVNSFDVVPVLRRWVEGGGMTPTGLSVDLGLFSGIREQDLRGPASHEEVLLRVWPQDPRLPAPPRRSTNRDPVGIVLEDGRLPASAWERLFGRSMDYPGNEALTHLAQLAHYDGVLDPVVTVPPALRRLEEGRMQLARFGENLHWLFERGGLRQLWPLGLAVAAAAAARSPKPPGLPYLLGGLATYAPEVPAAYRVVPPDIAALAISPGSTKSRAAARELVAALQADGERASA